MVDPLLCAQASLGAAAPPAASTVTVPAEAAADRDIDRDIARLLAIRRAGTFRTTTAASAVIRELPHDASSVVAELWNRGDDKGLLTERLAVRILVENLWTLSGTEWVDDQIINFYGGLCQARNDADALLPTIWIARTNMYNMIKEQGSQKVTRWTKKVDPNVFGRDMILFPMNLNDSHWCCGCVNMKGKRFELYDSKGAHEHEFYGHMRKWLTMEAEKVTEKGGAPINLNEWTNYSEDATIPRQDNYFDCGVFAMMFMSDLALGKPFAFSQADMPALRKRIAFEIATGALLAGAEDPVAGGGA